MFAKILLALCILGVVQGYPFHHEYQHLESAFDSEWQDHTSSVYEPVEQLESQRFRRQLNVQGGGSPRQGFDLSIDTRVPVWQNHNGRHSFDATGQYSQHLGGRYGNSRPNWGVGGVYTFRF